MSKTVLITGASSGIGKATALYFAAKGWNVAAAMRGSDPDSDFFSRPNIKQYQLDVSDQPAITKTVTAVTKDFGAIDVIVNNAGFATVGPFEASTTEQIKDQFAVNVFGLMDLTREVIPVFRSQGGGHIINVGSMGGRLAFPLYSAYHATKWAVDGFSESLMFELQPFNIHVKVIEPGVIKTEFAGRSEKWFINDDITAYDNYTDKIIGQYHQTYKQARTSPDAVARTIFKAAHDNSNRLRYVVGYPAPLLLTLRRILPEQVFRALVRTKLR